MAMTTIFLDGGDYKSSSEVHQALKRLLNLPDYYGMNADALHDCLSERTEGIHLHLRSMGEGEARDTLRKVVCVVEDLGGLVTGDAE